MNGVNWQRTEGREPLPNAGAALYFLLNGWHQLQEHNADRAAQGGTPPYIAAMACLLEDETEAQTVSRLLEEAWTRGAPSRSTRAATWCPFKPKPERPNNRLER